MNTHAGKTQENLSRSVGNKLSQKQGGAASAFRFADNRPVAIAQRKLHETANNSTKVRQLDAVQKLANNRAREFQAARFSVGNRLSPIVQRAAIKDQEGEKYHDSDYPGVRMERQEGSYPYKYKILNPGPHEGTIVADDDGEYFLLTEDREPDYERPFNLIDVVLGDPGAASNVHNIKIGQPGCGVVAGPGGPVTLSTSGLNSCVAWLLYNANAAYMEHILVGNPTKVKSDGISAQIAQIIQQFEENAGSAATDLRIHVDESQPAYKDSFPLWIGELIPSGVDVKVTMGAGNLSHEVPVSDSERILWRCSKISLQYLE